MTSEAPIAGFTRTWIAGRDWHRHDTIPAELWAAFAEAGLLGLGLPPPHGASADWRTLAAAGAALAETGGNQGLAMAWLAHCLVPKLHLLRLGSAAQRDRLLPGLAAGRHGIAVAISEPKAGAHPKLLRTRAVRDGGGWRLAGEKAYVSNGPLSDHAIVLAITDEVAGRKRFSGFLVPLDEPGVVRTAGVPIDFLKPMPHCGLRLDDVRLPAAALFGPEGEAFEAISLPMRRVEDAVGLGVLAGALRYELALVARMLGDEATGEDVERLGMSLETVAAIATLAETAAERLDRDGIDAAGLEAQADAARTMARALQHSLTGWLRQSDKRPPPDLPRVARDIDKSLTIAGAAYRARRTKAAEAWLRQHGACV